MVLFADESIVTESNDKSVTLTSHRICFEKRGLQTSVTKNIMLEHITSCESVINKYFFWLVLTLVGLLMLFSGANNNIKQIGGLLGIIGVAAFFLTRKAFVKVASPTSEILINVKGMDRGKVSEFIDKIEQTKHKRLVAVGGRSNLT
ncbi:MAG: hypothetical protein QM541_00595 [Flavobacterium sp.]|nr:hypothetical protein [Flavobacterium sp.]